MSNVVGAEKTRKDVYEKLPDYIERLGLDKKYIFSVDDRWNEDTDPEFFERAWYEGDKNFYDYWEDFIEDEKLDYMFDDIKNDSHNKKYAVGILMILARKKLFYVFNHFFIGDNCPRHIRKERIANGDFGLFLDSIDKVIDHTVEIFGKKKGDDGERSQMDFDSLKAQVGGWQVWFPNYVKGDVDKITQHRMKVDNYLYRPDRVNSNEGGDGWERMNDEEASYEDSHEGIDFYDGWKAFSKNPLIKEKLGKNSDFTYGDLFKALLQTMSVDKASDITGVAKNTVRNKVKELVSLLMSDECHNLDLETVGQKIGSNPEKYLRMISKKDFKKGESYNEGVLLRNFLKRFY